MVTRVFQPLQPHVRIWDSVSLSTLQIVGMGTFERGVGSLAFSKAVSVIGGCVSIRMLPHLHSLQYIT